LHSSYWLLDAPPYLQVQLPPTDPLNSLNVTFPSPGEYTVQFTLCEPFQGCCHTTRQRFTVTCVLSALDVQLRARRQDRSSVALSWAVNEKHPEQRFYVMRREGGSASWQTIALIEGETYTHTDRGLLPGRYIYQVSQSLPSGSVLMSNPAEVVLLHEGAHLMVEQRVRQLGESATVLWSLAEGSPRFWLYDLSGRLIHAGGGTTPEGSYEVPAPPAAGLYLLQVETPVGMETFRLVWQ